MSLFDDFDGLTDSLDPLGLNPFQGVGGKISGKDKREAREKKAAEEAMKAEMAAAAKAIADQRPLDYAAKINSLNQAAAMFEPANNMLDEMYGVGSKTNLKFTGDPTRMPGYQPPGAAVAAAPAPVAPAAAPAAPAAPPKSNIVYPRTGSPYRVDANGVRIPTNPALPDSSSVGRRY